MNARTMTQPQQNTANILSPIILLFAFFVTLVTIAFGGQAWQEYQEKQLLAGPAKGAESMYQERKYEVFETTRVGHEMSNTRAPGSYIRGLTIWETALNKKPSLGAAPWVLEMQHKERNELLKALSVAEVTVEDITALKIKLNKISPQLSDVEAVKLNRLTDQMVVLAITRESTARSVADAVYALGSGSEVLRAMGIYMPQFKPVQSY